MQIVRTFWNLQIDILILTKCIVKQWRQLSFFLADAFCLANYTSSMHAVMYNPVEPRLLATANAKEGLALWDVRKPRRSVQALKHGSKLQLKYHWKFADKVCISEWNLLFCNFM